MEGRYVRELLTLNELLIIHLINNRHRSILNELVIEEWRRNYNEDPLELIESLKSRLILEEKDGQFFIAQQYERQIEDTRFIYEITQERPKLLDEHKAYLVYRNNRNTPEAELLIRMYDDILSYSSNPEHHQQAHTRLSELFAQIGEQNHSENHMHCAQMLTTLLQMEATMVDVKMKSDADEIRARFPISNDFLQRYQYIVDHERRSPALLRDDILTAARQLKWDRQHLEAAANYIALRAEDDRNAEKYLLAYLFKTAKIYNVGTIKYMRKHRLEENGGRLQVLSTEQRKVRLTRNIEKPETKYQMQELPRRDVDVPRDDSDYRQSELDTPKKKSKKKRRRRRRSNNFLIIFFLIVFFPVGLVLMWTSHWRLWLKIMISVFYAMGLNIFGDDDGGDGGDGNFEDTPPAYEEEFNDFDQNNDPFFE